MPDQSPNARVTIISVTFNSMAVLPAMLASVPAGAQVVIVDNSTTQAAETAALADRHGARLIANAKNLGFGVACNQGAAVADTEFLLFLNPDATLAPDTLIELVAAAERFPRASAMNPRIAEADGSASFKRHSHLMRRAERMARGWPTSDTEVTVLSGAALFVRRVDFEAVGGFDPAIFLYHEDDDLSRRLRAERGPIMFVRGALVTHIGGASSARNAEVAALKAWHMGRSRVYSVRKHNMPVPFLSSLHSALRQLLSLSVLLSPRKRAKQWAFLRGVLSTLKDGGAHGGPRS
ncbi:N-acetylglucosaminyl-diphospho-decaprenol L-rhamnosyltransferase [mine drainage metagenome]|uniref:N-acetylglucosaminyl-diphospho-decaprenol L-rhamnosyltransferase n=1 Tax=mine drainage metagenome TaxID=410659 RepID=A0A1J5Q7G0_9ZZZZ